MLFVRIFWSIIHSGNWFYLCPNVNFAYHNQKLQRPTVGEIIGFESISCLHWGLSSQCSWCVGRWCGDTPWSIECLSICAQHWTKSTLPLEDKQLKRNQEAPCKGWKMSVAVKGRKSSSKWAVRLWKVFPHLFLTLSLVGYAALGAVIFKLIEQNYASTDKTEYHTFLSGIVTSIQNLTRKWPAPWQFIMWNVKLKLASLLELMFINPTFDR